MSRHGHRNRGKTSPLDKLPSHAKEELTRRCQGTAPLREIQAWIAEAHGLKTSITSLSDWWIRRSEEMRTAFVAERENGSTASAIFGGFEIVVSAVGATEIRIKVSPLEKEGNR